MCGLSAECFCWLELSIKGVWFLGLALIHINSFDKPRGKAKVLVWQNLVCIFITYTDPDLCFCFIVIYADKDKRCAFFHFVGIELQTSSRPGLLLLGTLAGVGTPTSTPLITVQSSPKPYIVKGSSITHWAKQLFSGLRDTSVLTPKSIPHP